MVSDEQLNEIKDTFKHKYYNSVSNICFEVLAKRRNKHGVSEQDLTKAQYEKIIEEAHEWFMTHFFDDFNIPED